MRPVVISAVSKMSSFSNWLLVFGCFLIWGTGHAMRCLTCAGMECGSENTYQVKQCPNNVKFCYSLSDPYHHGCAISDCSRIRAESKESVCHVCDTDECKPFDLPTQLQGQRTLGQGTIRQRLNLAHLSTSNLLFTLTFTVFFWF